MNTKKPRIAIADLPETAAESLTPDAIGRISGGTDIRTGDLVQLNLGNSDGGRPSRFDGDYYVTPVKHTF